MIPPSPPPALLRRRGAATIRHHHVGDGARDDVRHRPSGSERGDRRSRPGDEDGAVGGLEVLPFGLLVFVVGTLLIVNAWAVVDAKLAAEASAREAARAYVESSDAATAADAAREAASDAITATGRDPDDLRLSTEASRFARCAIVTVRTSYTVPAISLPFVGGFGDGIEVHGEHREAIDAFGAGLGPEHDCG